MLRLPVGLPGNVNQLQIYYSPFYCHCYHPLSVCCIWVHFPDVHFNIMLNCHNQIWAYLCSPIPQMHLFGSSVGTGSIAHRVQLVPGYMKDQTIAFFGAYFHNHPIFDLLSPLRPSFQHFQCGHECFKRMHFIVVAQIQHVVRPVMTTKKSLKKLLYSWCPVTTKKKHTYVAMVLALSKHSAESYSVRMFSLKKHILDPGKKEFIK